MISIKYLFEDIDFNSVPKKYKKRIARKCKVLKDFEKTIPDFSYPQQNTPKFEEDLNEVRRCVRDPSLSKTFLELSDKGAEDVFRKIITKDDFDWPSLKSILKELDALLLRMKFKYDRKRPYQYFEERGEDLETETAGSPSFPSGHTAFAYFLCDYFSHFFPKKSMELQTLAEMIGQSRIENGVHFPTDVSIGRFIGEQAAKHALSHENLNESFSSKDLQKTFVKFLRKKATNLRSNFDKKLAMEHYVNDMAVFVSDTTGVNFDTSYQASKNLLSGYVITSCSENNDVKRLFEGMIQVFFKNQVSAMSLFDLHRTIEEETKIRDYEKSTLSGLSHAPAKHINEYLTKACQVSQKPFLKLALINWIAPFTTGNKKITNLIFLKETGFNFDITNQIIIDEIDYMLENFYKENNIGTILD